MQKTGSRDQTVISSKYTIGYMVDQPLQQSNFGGTGTKSMHVSIETSLKRLQTDYIDLVRSRFTPQSAFCRLTPYSSTFTARTTPPRSPS
jgi:aryl-alcohol dehydrogenase-like predicted oxidoreductase